MTKPKPYYRKKVFTYLSAEDLKRINQIKTQYNFKSIYQILQYLIHCFLRVADAENDPIIEPVPDEIKDMFEGFSEAERDHIHKKFKLFNTKTPDSLK